MLEKAGKLEEAERVYRRALRIQSDDALLMNNLASVLAAQGRNLDEAKKLIEDALQRNPSAPDFRDPTASVHASRLRTRCGAGRSLSRCIGLVLRTYPLAMWVPLSPEWCQAPEECGDGRVPGTRFGTEVSYLINPGSGAAAPTAILALATPSISPMLTWLRSAGLNMMWPQRKERSWRRVCRTYWLCDWKLGFETDVFKALPRPAADWFRVRHRCYLADQPRNTGCGLEGLGC